MTSDSESLLNYPFKLYKLHRGVDPGGSRPTNENIGGGGGQTYRFAPPPLNKWKIHNIQCKNMFKKHCKAL